MFLTDSVLSLGVPWCYLAVLAAARPAPVGEGGHVVRWLVRLVGLSVQVAIRWSCLAQTRSRQEPCSRQHPRPHRRWGVGGWGRGVLWGELDSPSDVCHVNYISDLCLFMVIFVVCKVHSLVIRCFVIIRYWVIYNDL